MPSAKRAYHPPKVQMHVSGVPLIDVRPMSYGVGTALPNFPMVDQLHEPTSDGMPDENAGMNCVFASETAEIKFLRPGVTVNGDMIKDAVYGQGHTGGAAEEDTIPYLKSKFGVDVTVFHSADRSALLDEVRRQIALGHPVSITMPSAWNSQITKPNYDPNHPAWMTHAGAAFADTGSTIKVMNPWGGFVHEGTYQYWIDRLCWMKVYPVQLSGGGIVGLPQGWKDDGTTMAAPNGKTVVLGFRNFILNNSWDANDVPLEQEHGQDGDGTAQVFRNSGLRYQTSTGVVRWNIGELYLAAMATIAKLQGNPTPVPPTPPPAALDALAQAAITAVSAAQADKTKATMALVALQTALKAMQP